MDIEEEIRMALEFASSRGARKLDIIGIDPASEAGTAAMASRYGLSAEMHPFSMDSGMDAHQEERHEIFGYLVGSRLYSQKKLPDAILVLDDIMAKGVAMEIFKQGVKIPRDLLFMTHSNKGSGVFYPVPAVKIEFDPDRLVEAAGQMLVRSMTRGEKLAGNRKVPPELVLGELSAPAAVKPHGSINTRSEILSFSMRGKGALTAQK
jgi:DNA-binding LacI/PurR family transcriptional regulator